jgi:carboxypeptidase family protein
MQTRFGEPIWRPLFSLQATSPICGLQRHHFHSHVSIDAWIGNSRLITGGLMKRLSELHAALFPVIRVSTPKVALFLLSLLVVVCCPAFGQKDTGAIAGLVKDPSGAAVVGAKVTITDRGTTFDTITNGQGEYVAGPLKIGRYNVSVEKTGFKKTVMGPVTVDVQARLEVDLPNDHITQKINATHHADGVGIGNR